MSNSDALLRGIRTRLLISYPFFGSAVSDFNFAPDRNVKRFHSDGRSILYNDEFVEHSTPQELAYWLCREILHLTMDYGERKKHRSRILWALSAEYCVNSILAHEGLDRGVRVRFHRRDFSGKSAEEIYSSLVRESIKSGNLRDIEDLDGKIYGLETEPDFADIEQGLSGVAKIMCLNYDDLSEILKESLKRGMEYGYYKAKTLEMLSKARLSERTLGRRGFSVDLPITAQSIESVRWDDILSEYAFNDRESHSYRRFQRKYVSNGIFLPQRLHLFNNVIICIDVSASIGEVTLSTFFSDVLYLIGSRRQDISVRLIQIDAKIQSDVFVTAASELSSILRRKGFGGTDFKPLFDLLDQENNSEPVVIFTDGRANFPETQPDGYDVIWVTTDLKMPWGLNIEYGGKIEA